MKVLILNGNGFIGSQLAECLLTAGHQVDVYHRSPVQNIDRDGLRHIAGDRDSDFSALGGQSWDCTFDLGALNPSRVTTLAENGITQWGHYVLISSTEVYEPPTRYGFKESSILRQSDRAFGNQLGNYGYRKMLCEFESAIFPLRTIIRPTYVIGRSDPTSRFNRWVARICDGGDVVIPNPSNLPFQAVDVRDVALFLASVATNSTEGVFQLTAPFPPINFVDALIAIRDYAGKGNVFVGRPISELMDSGARPSDLPLWPGWNERQSEESGDPSLAMSVGFTPRPFEESIAWLVDGYYEGSTFI